MAIGSGGTLEKKLMEQQDITSTIIASAFKVHNTLGFGFLESVYQNAMIIELRKQGFRVEKQFPLEVYYEGQIVGDFKADLLVNHGIIIELKAVTQLQVAHEVQLVNYLNAHGSPFGLLINFGLSVEVKRKFRDYAPPKTD